MKKLISMLVAFGLMFVLASCGGADDVETTTPVVASACDQVIEYTECTLKKSGMSEDDVQKQIDMTKSAWDQLDQSEMEPACEESLKQLKQVPAVEGCEIK